MNVRKRGLALLMCICMIFTLLPFSALADNWGDDAVVYGTYGADGKWREDKTLTAESSVKHYPAAGETSDNDANIDYSKTAVKNNDGSYNVTLTIKSKTSETPPGASAVVLVIDNSGSMGDHQRLAKAKEAAKKFVDDYGTSGKDRYIALVSFADSANKYNFGDGWSWDNWFPEKVYWLDASNENNRGAINASIQKMRADGGTNLEQGLSTANDLFKDNAISTISKSNKYVIALTDGEPTFYGTGLWGYEGGTGNSCNETTYKRTIAAADTLKKTAEYLYTVCYGAENETIDYSNETVGDFLANRIASPGKAYNATDSENSLSEAFAKIYESIKQGISSGFTVTDPMGQYVNLDSASLTGNGASVNNGTITWKPKNGTTVDNPDGSKTTTYTLTYKVTLGEVPEDGTYPLNEDTTLAFKDGDADKTLHFNVPGVYREAPRYTVTYEPGEHGKLDGAAADGKVVTGNLKYGDDTPDAPDVNAAEGYYFTGWEPTRAETVTGNATYTAQYEKINNLSYTVHYYLNGTTQKVKDDKVVAGKIFEEVVTETYATIDGYTFAENEANKNKTITIGVENNEIIFYYYQNVTLTANSKTVAYNGETQSISGYTCSVDGVTFEGIEVGAEGKDVGDYPAEFPERTVGKVDTTGKYIVAVANSGKLTIYRVTDAVTTIEAKKWLDGDAPSNGMFSFRLVNVKDNSDVAEATNTANGSVSFSKIYSSEGTYIYKLSEVKGNDTGIVYDNTEYYVKVEVKLVEKTYNAEVSYFANEACTEQLLTDLPTFNNTTKPTGSLTISKTVSGNAASTTKEFTFIVKLIPNSDTTNNNIIYGNVTNVTVIDDEISFKLKAGDSKTINGLPDGIRYTVQELDSNGYTVSAKVNDDPVQLENNMLEGTIAAGVETKIVFNNHKSYVYPPNPPIMDEITVEITGNSDSVVYDGTEHSVKGYTVKISDPRYTEADFTFTGKAEASGVNAGTYEMGLKAEQFKNTNARFTNVKFVIKADGVLTITPKELIITAGSKTEYGPTPVTCGEWTVSGLAAGDKVESVKITGIQSVPGSSPNVPSDAVIKNAKGEDVTKNYAIKYVNGTLTMLEVLNKEDHFNYIIGTPEGLSLPTANVTRAEVATIFFRLMTDDARAKFDSLDNSFSDVAKGKWYNRAISTLANAGIIKGDPAGTYRPGDPITRAEMAAIIARFGDFKEGGKTFNDISGHWAQKYIELAASNGWINGNPDGTFKPNNNITRAETVAMINRVLDRQTKDVSDLLPVSQMTNWSDNMDTAKWYYRDMQEATNNHKAERVGNSIYEKWTEKLPDIDWASYQI